jgi:hypothetical protein
MNKLFSVFKGTLAIVVHFAHGGLLAVGVMVSVFIGMRVSEAGLTPRIMPALPEFSLINAIEPASGSDPSTLDFILTRAEPPASAQPLSIQQKTLAEQVSRRHRVARAAVEQYMLHIYAAAAQYRLDPLLLVALISVESAFNPAAESAWGAQGLTQVIPRFHPEKLALHGPDATLLDPRTSIFVGAQVLREYIRSAGSVEAGLQRYVGSIEDPDLIYSNKVLNEHRRLQGVFAPLLQTAQAAI